MILYDPIEGSLNVEPVNYRPRSCFIMTQLGGEVDPKIIKIRKNLSLKLTDSGFIEIDANSKTTGGDYMTKIWKLLFSCSIGVAIISESLPNHTIGNIFYELGLMNAYGKETIVIKSPKSKIPSDFTRNEYITAKGQYGKKIKDFLEGLKEKSDFYEILADQLSEGDPVQAIDYLRRAFLLTENSRIKKKAKELFRAKTDYIDRKSSFFIKDFLRELNNHRLKDFL